MSCIADMVEDALQWADWSIHHQVQKLSDEYSLRAIVIMGAWTRGTTRGKTSLGLI